MGILNVTPDSFSGDGLWTGKSTREVVERTLAQADSFVAAGVDIFDVGGESTRPGAPPVSAEEESARVLPVIEALAKRFSVPISVDTSKASVARRALEAGAHLVNDVWGLRLDPQLRVLGYPLLVGPSRKSFIGYTLHVPLGERIWGTAAAVALCVARGTDIVRVHDVLEMGQVCRMADAIVRRNDHNAL